MHLIVLAISLFFIANINAAQESKAEVEERSEVVVIDAADKSAPVHGAAVVVKPWQTFLHSKFLAVLWPIVFSYTGNADINMQWSSDDCKDILVSPDAATLCTSHYRLHFPFVPRSFTRRNMTTGAPELHSGPVSDQILPLKKYFLFSHDRIIEYDAEGDGLLTTMKVESGKTTDVKRILYGRKKPIVRFNDILLIANDNGEVEHRDPHSLIVEKKFIAESPDDKEKKITAISGGGKFILAQIGNVVSIFRDQNRREIFPVYVFRGLEYEIGDHVIALAPGKFAIRSLFAVDIINIKNRKKNTFGFTNLGANTASMEKMAKNRILFGDRQGYITDVSCGNNSYMINQKLEHEHDASWAHQRPVIYLQKKDANTFLSMNDHFSIKLWALDRGECLYRFEDPSFGFGDYVYPISDGYVVRNQNCQARFLVWKSPLHFAYDREYGNYGHDRKKLKELTKKSAALPAAAAAPSSHAPAAVASSPRKNRLALTYE